MVRVLEMISRVLIFTCGFFILACFSALSSDIDRSISQTRQFYEEFQAARDRCVEENWAQFYPDLRKTFPQDYPVEKEDRMVGWFMENLQNFENLSKGEKEGFCGSLTSTHHDIDAAARFQTILMVMSDYAAEEEEPEFYDHMYRIFTNLLESIEDPNLEDLRGDNLLNWAIYLRLETRAVEALINKGIDVNNVGIYAATILRDAVHRSLIEQFPEIAKLLLEAGADPHAELFHRAFNEYRPSIVESCHEKIAKLTRRKQKNCTELIKLIN